jgi:hypothetical protein
MENSVSLTSIVVALPASGVAVEVSSAGGEASPVSEGVSEPQATSTSAATTPPIVSTAPRLADAK